MTKQKPATLRIVCRKTKVVVMCRGRVVFATYGALNNCKQFIEGWREGELERGIGYPVHVE